jgi:hypothetical protein
MNVTVCSQLMTHVTGVYPICFPHLSGTSWGFSIYAIYAINFNRLRRPTATNTPEKNTTAFTAMTQLYAGKI